MKVKMLVNTFYGKQYKVDDIADIDKDTANRWIENRIAEPCKEPKSKDKE